MHKEMGGRGESGQDKMRSCAPPRFIIGSAYDWPLIFSNFVVLFFTHLRAGGSKNPTENGPGKLAKLSITKPCIARLC